MKTKAKKLLAMLLALMMVLPLTLMVSAADNAVRSKGFSSPSISDVSDILDMISYEEYDAKYDKLNVGKGQASIEVSLKDNLYVSGDKESTIPVTEKEIEGVKSESLLIPDNGTVTFVVNVPEVENKEFPEYNGARYTIEIVYCHEGSKSNSIERVFYLNDSVPFSEARSIVLTKVWQYEYEYENGKPVFKQEIMSDGTKGNDIRPNVELVDKWSTHSLSDANGYISAPFEFYFQGGENTISFESQREPIVIKSITLKPAQELPKYKDYLALIKEKFNKTPEKNSVSANATHIFQAETPDYVSAVTMYPVNDRTSPITVGVTGTGEQSSMYTLLNTAGKEKWQNVGEWMEYTIDGKDIKESGFYSLAVRYKQALLSGMYVSRKLYIKCNDDNSIYDGSVPFAEANNCRFPYADSWSTIFLSDGSEEPFQFYFEKGKSYTIRLEVSLGDMAEIVNDVSASLSNINASYLEILKLTGSTPDANRDYGFARVMPDVLNTMVIEANRLKNVYDELVEQTGGKSEKTSTIEQVYLLLEKMARDESEIAGNLGTLKSHIGSLGTWINSVKTQPLQVDAYTLQSAKEELPDDEANFFVSLWFEIKLFFASFITDYSAIGGDEDDKNPDDNRIQVWVVTGRDQAQIIRNLIENKFTPNHKIEVDLKLVSGGTLLPSVLAGVGPDVSLMESSTMIIDYALRNAVIPLNDFMEADAKAGLPDIKDEFPDAAMVPLTLYNYDTTVTEDSPQAGVVEELYYGLPDSLSFSMMFYRKDVLASLGYSIDDIKTWDDLLSILPVLQYNNMEIGIANDIYTFIYQSGNQAYSTDLPVRPGQQSIPGLRINFDNVGVLEAFTKLCNLYTQYSLPYQFDFANRFRTGEMPIGISAYTTCNQLAIFASELSGLWGFVPLPGYEVRDEAGALVYDDEGNKVINNTSMATVTGCVMLDGCDNGRGAWEFMKWYVSDDFQVDYSDEIVSIVGIASRPATANREALMELPWTTEEWANINAQFDSLDAVPNHPGSYYLARYVNFAFLAAYNEGKDPADALLSYVPTINKEITRKREEFDMYTHDQYITDVENYIKELEEAEQNKQENENGKK